jgi:fatty-acyl-CoA synthase
VLRDGAALDAAALYHHVEQALPGFARPAFVRVAAALDTTATLKLKKVALREAGWDPARCTDPIFVRDDVRQAFVPLTPETHASLSAGAGRL